MSSHTVTVDISTTEFDIDLIINNIFVRYIILLPNMDDIRSTLKLIDNVYYIIDLDWCELGIDEMRKTYIT